VIFYNPLLIVAAVLELVLIIWRYKMSNNSGVATATVLLQPKEAKFFLSHYPFVFSDGVDQHVIIAVAASNDGDHPFRNLGGGGGNCWTSSPSLSVYFSNLLFFVKNPMSSYLTCCYSCYSNSSSLATTSSSQIKQ